MSSEIHFYLEHFQFAITQGAESDPSQHPCLLVLPIIFLKAMKGLAAQVDAFLGKFSTLERNILILLCSHLKLSQFLTIIS